jgi:hypothetical protein
MEGVIVEAGNMPLAEYRLAKRCMELEQRINLLQIAGDEAIKQRNDALRERDEARAEAERLREALKHACIAVGSYSGSCPYDVYDSCQFPERCTDQYSECWQKYFDNKGHADFLKGGGE